jgi:hypothetical protein
MTIVVLYHGPNFKDKYAPNFPRIKITHLSVGRIARKDELEEMGLVASGGTA